MRFFFLISEPDFIYLGKKTYDIFVQLKYVLTDTKHFKKVTSLLKQNVLRFALNLKSNFLLEKYQNWLNLKPV